MDALRATMCAVGRRAYGRQLVDGTAGNFSCRLDAGRILCTPTMICKGLLNPDDLCVIDLEGRQLAGGRPASSEALMHLELYAESPAVGAVVHTHPPYATTLACMGRAIPEGVMPEGDVFLGPVPLIPYQTTGTREMGSAIRPHVNRSNAALLESHGAVTWGPDLETAYCLSETLEAVCRVAYQADVAGGLKLIPTDQRAALLALRNRVRASWAASSKAST
jgi:L-fuculose-phosphate aldolase